MTRDTSDEPAGATADAEADDDTRPTARVETSDDFPEVVCLSGSTRFKQTFREENERLTVAGAIVLSVGFFFHVDGPPEGASETELGEAGAWKESADELHLRKIDLADRLHVIDVDGYVGESTRNEIAYAREHDVPVTWYDRAAAPDELVEPGDGSPAAATDAPAE